MFWIRLLTEMEEFRKQKLSAVGREKLMSAISYFKNNYQERRMDYAEHNLILVY